MKLSKIRHASSSAAVTASLVLAALALAGCGTERGGKPIPVVKPEAPKDTKQGEPLKPKPSKPSPTEEAALPPPAEKVGKVETSVENKGTPVKPAEPAVTPPVRTSPLGAEYAFTDVTCTKGKLTALARLENQLNSKDGLKVKAFLPGLNSSENDFVTLRRNHKWIIKQTVAVRETTLLVQSNGKVLKFSVDKNFDVSTPAKGRLKLVHGKYERQSVQNVNVQPALDLVAEMVLDAQLDAALPEELRDWLSQARQWFQVTVAPTLNSALVRSVVNHLQETYKAEELVNWTLKDDVLTFAGTQLRLPDFAFANQLRVYDQSMCGLGGEAKRTFRTLAVDR
jgi:hypothetical protein